MSSACVTPHPVKWDNFLLTRFVPAARFHCCRRIFTSDQHFESVSAQCHEWVWRCGGKVESEWTQAIDGMCLIHAPPALTTWMTCPVFIIKQEAQNRSNPAVRGRFIQYVEYCRECSLRLVSMFTIPDYFYSKPNKMHQCTKFILFWNDTTCFGRSFLPSSGVQDCAYSNRHLSNRYCCLLVSGYSLLLYVQS